MSERSENTKRIARNTLMLYLRMLFGMLVALYTSRLVLQALGEEDYGIYNVVGGVVAMFSLVSTSLSSSVGRFLTFELGRGNEEGLKRIFSTALTIHLLLALVIIVLAETLGIWFLNTHMTIPAERLGAANWVLHASAAAFAVNLTGIPFSAAIISHERMGAFAGIGILDILLRLLVVLGVAWEADGDRLILYAWLLAAESMLMRVVYWAYCRRNFVECREPLRFDSQYWRALSSFAGWNFIGCSAGLLKDQGVNILLNLFFGPVVNAARGIANTVNSLLSSFSGNFMTALNPQITKSYAAGERDYMFSLVERGARFSYYILLLLALPMLLETEFVLNLWLKSYPAHTVNFVRLILLLSLCDILSNTLITLQTATGRIRNYQIVVGGMLLMNFPLSYLALHLGLAPESTMVVALGVSVCCLLLRLGFLRTMAGLSVRRYLRRVCLNVLFVTVTAAVLPAFVHSWMSDGWLRFVVTGMLTVSCTLASIYWVGCTAGERLFIRQKIEAGCKKFSL